MRWVIKTLCPSAAAPAHRPNFQSHGGEAVKEFVSRLLKTRYLNQRLLWSLLIFLFTFNSLQASDCSRLKVERPVVIHEEVGQVCQRLAGGGQLPVQHGDHTCLNKPNTADSTNIRSQLKNCEGFISKGFTSVGWNTKLSIRKSPWTSDTSLSAPGKFSVSQLDSWFMAGMSL